MKIKNVLRLLSGASLVVLSGIAQAWTISDLTAESGIGFIATSINNAGSVAGNGGIDRDVQAYVYSKGIYTKLDRLSRMHDRNSAAAINNNGQVTGISWFSQGRTLTAYLYDRHNIIDLEAGATNNPFWSMASGINESGQVVGDADVYNLGGVHFIRRAFLYSNGVLEQIGTLEGNAITLDYNSHGADINNAGQIVGQSNVGPLTNKRSVAFSYAHGTMTNLGTLPGHDTSGALALNDAGQIVGYSRTRTGPSHAFFYSRGSMIDIGAIGGVASSVAYDINNRGQVVGGSFENNLAFLYANGNFIDLNSLSEVQTSGWKLTSAIGINDRGQIIGAGIKDGQTRSFLLTP